MQPPANPKIYHIVHVDRLPSIFEAGCLWCYEKVKSEGLPGTNIGKPEIKERRLSLPLRSRPGLHVGACVPFNFCPRSVMLYVIHKKNAPDLPYKDGQESIVHLVADLHAVVRWADEHQQRWAFTLSNAASKFFEDRCNLNDLSDINWKAVRTNKWNKADFMEGKQAEFLVECSFSWELVSYVGVYSSEVYNKVCDFLHTAQHKPCIEPRRDWYY